VIDQAIALIEINDGGSIYIYANKAHAQTAATRKDVMSTALNLPTRRFALLLLSGSALMISHVRVRAERSTMTVYKDPSCGCCLAWAQHLTAAGFTIAVVETPRLDLVKARLPAALASCHTAEVGNYAIEGHVPAGAIARLLVERPAARGLAVPGMPIGAPGMDGSPPETYEVVLFGPHGRRTFARYLGSREI
jgi:hypothetical protein